MQMHKTIAFLLTSSSLFANPAFIVDPYFSPYTGGNDLLFAQWALIKAGDYFHSPKVKDSTSAVWRRTLEQLGLLGLSTVSCVVQHEVFGHGYRLRELGITPSQYEIGFGEGATFFEVDDSFRIGEMLAVDVAGLEAEFILAQIAKMNWIQSRTIDGRLGMNYFLAEQSLFWYTLITHLGKIEDKSAPEISGNDVESYITLLNASYPSDHLTIGTLTLWASFNWLDPMTFYSLFSWFYYIALGKPFAFPMIQLQKEIYYLPNIRIGYAPYGPEAYFENFFSLHNHPLYAYIKGGKRSVGIGGYYDYLFLGDKGALGLHFDGWVQNQYISSATFADFMEGKNVAKSSLKNKVWGLAASISAHINLFSPSLQLYAEIGGKTEGYLPGYSLGSGVVARIGLVFGEN